MMVWIGNMNYKQILAIKKTNLNRILKLCPECNSESGIYLFFRTDENGVKYAYIGQAKHFQDRMPDHLTGYTPFDLSLKKHGLYSDNNPYGYIPAILEVTSDLDNREQYWITYYAKLGYQLRNVTTGSQGTGKKYMDVKSPKTYTEGKVYGYNKALKEIKELFAYVTIVPKDNKAITNKKYNKLLNLLSDSQDI